MEFTFEPCKATQTDQALQNCAFLNTSDYKICCDKVQTVPLYLQANGIVMLCQPLPEVKAGYIMLNAQLRTHARISLISKAAFMAFISSQQNYLESVQFTVAPKKTLTNIDSDELFNIVKQSFNNRYFYPGAIYYTDYQGTTLEMSPKQEGILNSFTQISFSPAPAAKKLILSGSHVDGTTVGQSALSDAFKKMAKSEIEGGDQSENEIDIQSIGIGGLNAQFTQIFRRAFVSRMFPPHLVRKYDLQHVRGILLFGPPGTGKTLIARKIGQLLNTKEPKIVSGPEILDMYVGNSEANIRKLFADAEKDWKELGDESELHLIVMDELDAICKQRGSRGDSTGTYDSIVNQLLAKMDGVDSLGNILVVGMTNRKDLIDSALLRPGRFEVHVEIHLPDLQGRHQILLIHTKTLNDNEALGVDVDLLDIAGRAQNFSGSEIAGLVRSAQSFAMSRVVSGQLLIQGKNAEPTAFTVTQADFVRALGEVHAGFGRCDPSLFEQIQQFNFLPLTASAQILETIQQKITASQNAHIHLSTLILTSFAPGTGKSSILAQLCKETKIEFIKFISADSLIRQASTEQQRAAIIAQAFDDANRVPEALIVLDGIEQIVQFAPSGMRYSNVILQTILPLLKNPRNGRVFVLASTNCMAGMSDLGVLDCFINRLSVGTMDLPSMQEVVREWCMAKNLIFQGNLQQFQGFLKRQEAGIEISLNQLLFALEYARGSSEGANLIAEDLEKQLDDTGI